MVFERERGKSLTFYCAEFVASVGRVLPDEQAGIGFYLDVVNIGTVAANEQTAQSLRHLKLVDK